jgi:ABC-2 type transport system ATP-binding protein
MAAKVRDLLKKIYRERNVGILYTSHNMFEVEILCNRLIFIHKGKMIAEGTPEDIRKRFTTSSLDEAFIKMARGGELTEGASS